MVGDDCLMILFLRDSYFSIVLSRKLYGPDEVRAGLLFIVLPATFVTYLLV